MWPTPDKPMTALDIYLWQQADVFRALCFSLAIVSLFGVALLSFAKNEETQSLNRRKGSSFNFAQEDLAKIEEQIQWLLVKRKWALAAFFTLGMLGMVIPSTKTIALMVTLPAIANSEPVQKDLPELYQLAKEALKEQVSGKANPSSK